MTTDTTTIIASEMSDEIKSEGPVISNDKNDLPVLNDEIGRSVVLSANEIEIQLDNLVDNLERQFNESSEINGEKESNADDTSERNSLSEKEQIDEIINILNENDSNSSEEHFNNPSFDELDILSKVQYGLSNSFLKIHGNDKLDGDESDDLNQTMSAKIFELIDSMKTRVVELEDEWDNDDDTGYITVTLSDQEFFEYEDVRRNLPI